ncbi:MAG: hypothetical protein IPK82_34385 [Polyangiaceae bacterium]|nr:hypothetical protein [Polyangiaceae bacterium]
MRLSTLGILGLALGALGGCSKEPVCDAGATQQCLCTDGAHGAQSCADDGSRWEACACAKASPRATGPQALVPDPSPTPQQPEQPTPPVATPRPVNDAPVSVGAQPYTITIISADIAPSKPDGRGWDVGNGPPDPVVTVTVRGAGSGTVRSSKLQDTTSPNWRESGQVTINRGDHLSVSIVDKDLAADDPIASWDIEFLRPGQQRLTDPAHSVNALLIDISAAPK